MKQNNNIEHIRSFFIVFIIVLLYATIIARLYYVQVVQQDFYKNLAEKQYSIHVTTLPERAYIFDRNGTPVALHKDTFSAFFLPKQIKEKQKLIEFVSKHFPAAQERMADCWDKNFFFIARRLTDKEQELITNAHLEDIHLLQEPSRFYPYASLSTILGITNIDNIGILGLEQEYNETLQGCATVHTLKKDARNNKFYFEKELTIQGSISQPLHLTVDADLQFKVCQILQDHIETLEAKEGGVVVMNPDTGEIYAMASYPYFDPNNTETLDIETTKNRPVTQAFETGSVIKTFSALAALDLQVTNLDEMINCENTKETKIEGIRVRTVQPHGTISFKEVVQYSNNIGTVKIIKRIHEKLYDYYTKLGFGSTTGLQFPGEQSGFVNHPKNWSAYSIISLSFGYEITVTLLQLARALSVIYNGGYLVTPTLIKKDTYAVNIGEPIVQEKTRHDMDLILQGCVQQGSGKRASIPGYKITGKTGTANILEHGTYNEKKHLNTFIGYVEKGTYKRVITLYVKESKKAGYSSMISAPLFRKVAEAMVIHDHEIAHH